MALELIAKALTEINVGIDRIMSAAGKGFCINLLVKVTGCTNHSSLVRVKCDVW